MASGVLEARFVRCPKCHQVLMESADVPVYRCGGCGTVLRAKNRKAVRESVASGKLESITSPNNLLEYVSQTSNDGSLSLCKQSSSCSPNGMGSEMDTGGENVAVPLEDTSSKQSEQNCHKKVECSENGECSNKETGSDFGSPRPKGELALMGTNPAFMARSQTQESDQAIVTHHLDGQVGSSLQDRQHDSDNLRSKNEVKEATDHSTVPEEDTVDSALANNPGDIIRSPTTRSSCANDGSISSFEDNCNDRHLDRPQKLSSESAGAEEVQGREVSLPHNKMDTGSESQLLGKTLPSKSSNKRYGSAIMDSFDLEQDESPLKNGIRAYERETSRDSDDFYSVQNWMESEKGILSRSLSKDSGFLNEIPSDCESGGPLAKFRYPESNHKELLRKVDELRDQISRLFGQQGKGKGRSYIRGMTQGNWLPSLYDNESEQECQCCCASIPQCSSIAVGPRKHDPQICQLSSIPLFGQAKFFCSHCHQEDWQVSIKLIPCHNNACMGCPYHNCRHPSTSASPWSPMAANVSVSSHSFETSEQEWEKHRTAKRYCRPVSGGAPFVICYKCLQLLQLPADFLISKRRHHKLRCGNCSVVNTFEMNHGRAHIVVSPSCAEIEHPPSEIDDGMDAISRPEMVASYAKNCLQGDPVSYTEEYGFSFSKSDSSEGEHAPPITSNYPVAPRERDGHRRMRPSLHQLMGYSSPSEIIN